MNRTKIDWVVNPDGAQGFSWNPVVGCTHWQNQIIQHDDEWSERLPPICAVGKDCWARKQAKRLKHRCELHYTFKPHLHLERLGEPYKRKKPSTIAVCLMGDLLCKDVPDDWIEMVIQVARDNPQHIFLFLTKNPKRYKDFNFPENCWLGATVNTADDVHRIIALSKVAKTNKTFISFEPLYALVSMEVAGFVPPWIIIGAQTDPDIQPETEHVARLIDEAMTAQATIFLKDNLRGWAKVYQNIPWSPIQQKETMPNGRKT